MYTLSPVHILAICLILHFIIIIHYNAISQMCDNYFFACGVETPFVRELVRGDDGRGEGGRLSDPEACKEGDTGRNDAEVGSDNFGAAAGVWSLRLHCSSSTSFADWLIRNWWNPGLVRRIWPIEQVNLSRFGRPASPVPG
jgi:hypothetical protein